jgi:hypothetical protein
MNVLSQGEWEEVSAGLEVEIDIGIIRVLVSGGEMASAYEFAVSRVTDFFMWWDTEGVVQLNS